MAVTLRANGTYVDTFQTDGFGGLAATTASGVTPRFKGKLDAGLEQGPTVVSTAMNYIHHYWEGFAPASAFTPNTFGQNGNKP